ncbi:MCP four helix bundle domain-containing protein, partial [Flavobacterium sp.]|uniref:MCP four helix bundle domain-containing protein n=1 Tax=Flavobacterium sp. TaxID=239 RepID=UPI00374FF82E
MNFTIKSKLFGGYIIILMLLISLLFFMTKKLSESNDQMQNIVAVYSKKVNLSNEIMIAMLEAARHEKNIILIKDLSQKDYFKDRIYREIETIDKKTKELKELVDDKGKVILKEFETT